MAQTTKKPEAAKVLSTQSELIQNDKTLQSTLLAFKSKKRSEARAKIKSALAT